MAFKNKEELRKKLVDLDLTDIPYVDVTRGDYITLDGRFTVDDLKLIVEIIEQHQKENP